LSTSFPNREEEIRWIYAQLAPQIDNALVARYRLPRSEAERVGQELYEWFHRLCRRPGMSSSPKLLRPQLLSMACRVGHVYWSGQGGLDNRDLDDTVRRSLALGPEIIAIEIENGLNERRKEEEP
jgi:hypothetical protein